MQRLLRILTILFAAVASAALANGVHPRRIGWFVPRDVIWPPPTPHQAQAFIGRDELPAAMEQAATFVDARRPERFREGHIPGAINIPAEEAASHLEAVLERTLPDDLVIVYCGGETCDDSRIVFDVLKANGFTNVRLYPGGWRDWIGAGGDVEN